MEYDTETNQLKTVSLHCFEDDDLRVSVHSDIISVFNIKNSISMLCCKILQEIEYLKAGIIGGDLF